MTEIEVMPQKIVNAKTVILRSRLDYNIARLQGEKYKRSFFARFGFLTPKTADVQLVYFEKYYEPYIVLGGRYSIDYCKRHVYTTRVDECTGKVIVGGEVFKPETVSLDKSTFKAIKLEGEEYARHINEGFFILDRLRREIQPINLFFAPSEEENVDLEDIDCNFRKVKSSLEADIEFLRSKIAKRPSDVGYVMRETFDVNERSIIYCPVYELTYQNMKNAREVTLLIDGISGKMTLFKFRKKSARRFSKRTN
jgi:hypothetical protein